MAVGLSLDQVNQLEQKQAISPQTAEILRAELAVPGDQTAAPKTLNIPPPDYSQMPPSAGGDFGAGFSPIVTGPSTVSPEALSHTPAPLPTPPGESAVAAPNLAPVVNPVAAPSPNDLIQSGYAQEKSAITDAEHAAAQAQTGVLAESIKKAQMMEDARKEEERFQQEKKERLDKGEEAYKQALADLNEQKIDPNRIYANASTADKIIAGIGIALGGIASGMSGKPNAAMQVIKDAIDRDIESQKVEVDKKARGVSAQGSLYNELVGRLQNEDAARHYMTSLLLERSKSVMDQYKTQISTASQQAELGKLKGAIDVASGEAKLKAQEALEKDPAYQQAVRAGVKTGKIDEASLPKEDRERYIKDLGFATDKQAKDDIVKAQQQYNDAVRIIDEIKKARESGKGSEVLDRNFVGEQKGRAASLMLKLKDIYQLGVLSASDLELLGGLVPQDPTEFTFAKTTGIGKDPVVGKLDRLKKEFTDSYKGKLKTLIEPTQGAENQSTDLQLTPR